MNSAETKQKIVAAVKNGFGSIAGIKRESGIEAFRDITDMISELIDQKEIRRVSKGDLVAYFPYSKMPSSFYFAGGGRVEAEYVEGFTPRDDAAKAAEMTGQAAFNRPFSENGAKMTNNRGPIGKQKPSSPDMDLAEVERVAREGMTAKQAAEHFGMTLFVFKNRLTAKTGRFAPVREAWYRGRKAAGVNGRGTKKGERRGPRQTVKKAEALAFEPFIGQAGGVAVDGEVVAGNEVAAPPKVRPEFEELDAFVQTVKKRQAGHVHHRHIDLKNGGQIVVGFEGNVFDCTPNELLFICDLGERLRSYEQEVTA